MAKKWDGKERRRTDKDQPRLIKLDRGQFGIIKAVLKDDIAKWIGAIAEQDGEDGNKKTLIGVLEAGFNKVAEAILKKPSEPPPTSDAAVEGKIVARYKFGEDQAPVTFTITCGDLKSAKGTPVGAGDIDLSIDSSSTNLAARLGPQTVSADGNSVSADVTLTGADSMPNTELAVVAYHAKNRDTGNEVAADVDEFETGPGEASIGTIDSPVGLPEVPSA